MKNNLSLNLNSYRAGYVLFKLTIIFLPSLPLLASLFGLIALLISSVKTRENYLSDKFNYPLIGCSIFMLISIFVNQFKLPNFELFENIIRLSNWLPLFWCFWGFQIYLDTSEKRKECMKFLLIGSFPVLIGGFLQYFFQVHGPFTFLGNIWFQRGICSGKFEEICVTGITSVFSNPNYYSSWLMMIFPVSLGYSIYLLKENNKSRYFYIFYTLSILFASTLTSSRNAYIGIIFTLMFFFYRKRNKITFFAINSLIASILIIYFFALFTNNGYFLNLIYTLFKANLNDINLINFLSFTRINLWIDSISLIIKNPLFGSGIFSASSLTLSEVIFTESFKHTHNIILEVSALYGIVASIFLFSTIYVIYIKSLKNIFSQNKFIKESDSYIIEMTWLISFSALFLSNMFDLAYYDIKISLPLWIFLSGLRTSIKFPWEDKLTKG